MNALAAALLLMLIAAVAAIALAPLGGRRRRRGPYEAKLAELEAEREAKYREIRDAELDHRLGKLTEGDYEAVDATLRREALAILDGIEQLRKEAEERLAEGEATLG